MARTKTGSKVGISMEIHSTSLYDKIDALNEVLDQLLYEGELLDYPELNNSIQELYDDTHDWLDEHSPSEDEQIAHEIVSKL